MNFKNFAQLKEGLLNKEFSAIEIAKFFLEKIEKEDKKIKSFLTLTPELALSQAKILDEMIYQGRKLPTLAGMPIAIKDNILVSGFKCTAGSKILKNYIAPYDATVVEKLKEEGAIILGKTNLDEFAMGSSTENSAFFPTKNPIDLTRVPGGSSGGSAAAVAAGFCLAALGSDTGGSIRQPASFCGIVGLKPTYGAVSRYGLVAFASSLDQIGPLAKNVKDCKLIFDVIKGKDKNDSTSVKFPEIKDLKIKIQNLKFGVPKEYFTEGLDKNVEKVVREAIKKFELLGAKILEISLPHTPYALACYFIISRCEAASNLARYDGVKYGLSKGKDLMDLYFRTRGEGFGKEVKRRILLGNFALSSGYYEAYYLKAQKVRTKIYEDFQAAFKKVDLILTPTTPTVAFKLGEKIEDPLTMYLADIFTVSVNLAGICAISIPCGFVQNLPVGLQIIGPAFSEEKIFKVAEIFEENFER